MNKQRLTKQLDAIATNVARKGVYVVTKQDDTFVVQEHITKAVVAKELPMKCVATYLCKLRNKGKAISLPNKIKLEGLMTQYFRFKNDIMFYRHTLKHTKDFTLGEVVEARLFDTICKFNFTKDELKRFN
jgi:hypothetical protein